MLPATQGRNLGGGRKSCEIPRPRFNVGDQVRWARDDHRSYFERQYLRHLIRRWRLRKKGRLGGGAKRIIREVMTVVRAADVVEVVGVVADGMHSFDYAQCNQCYIGGVPGASSPMEHRYQLLIRWQQGGNMLAMATRLPIATDRSLSSYDPE